MYDAGTIQKYINNFRRFIAPNLKSGIGIACKVIPVKSDGAILEFSLGSDVLNDDKYMDIEESVNAALKKIQQRMFGGNLDGIRFAGTNISMEPNRIILIKGDDTVSEWNEKSAEKDVKRILTPLPERRS
jgi:hypothetical protein